MRRSDASVTRLARPILHVVGARPNFVKAAPMLNALAQRGASQLLIHTGQHYDPTLSDVLFQQLSLPAPDLNLNVGSGSHAVQTARMMIRLERALRRFDPGWVIVYGDVNSTLAAALVCAKLSIPFAHVEAGLRSDDRAMPEEINRRVVDALADRLFTPSADADDNLRREGIDSARIQCVGNVMIDSLVKVLPFIDSLSFRSPFEPPRQFALVTLHRPENVDEPGILRKLLDTLLDISSDFALPMIFPVHPHTRARLDRLDVSWPPVNQFHMTDPLGYLEFIALEQRATLVITDSGGVQEETTFLGVPCLTVRDSTERPITVTLGTNILVGQDKVHLRTCVEAILAGHARPGQIPPLWDGHSADRIADSLLAL
ncbi:MAG: non-hydrolyzing UDP-N-acetylglucosamine 2-epimerase [Aggregatilineales bacterium]